MITVKKINLFPQSINSISNNIHRNNRKSRINSNSRRDDRLAQNNDHLYNRSKSLTSTAEAMVE